MNSLHLSGGMREELDYPVSVPKDIDNYGENFAFWLFDDKGEYFVLVHIETIIGYLRNRREYGWILAPEGRVLTFQNEGPNTSGKLVSGACAAFHCDVPFERWSGGFHGTMQDTTASVLAAGPLADGPRAIVELDMQANMAVPPWTMGGISKLASEFMGKDPGTFIGGFRYEQLYRAEVALMIDGRKHHFTASGLRTHRAGPRNIGKQIGHSWLTNVFPSGRAFGLLRFPGDSYSEGFVYRDGRVHEATIKESPWLTDLRPSGERFEVVLESALGIDRIECETAASSFLSAPRPQGTDIGWVRGGLHPDSLILAHGGVRMTWNGEQSYGLIERSAEIGALQAKALP